MSNRPTPETDAEAITPSGFEDNEVSAEFARKLRRERDEAREALRAVLELANDIPDESLDGWKIEFHKVLEEAKYDPLT